VKETHIPSKITSGRDYLAIQKSSYLVAQESEINTDKSLVSQHANTLLKPSGEETNKVQASWSAEQPTLDLVQGAPGSSQTQAEVQSNSMPATWNQGVQSGLRTSFGRKSQSRRTPSNSLIPTKPEDNRQFALPSVMQVDVPMQLDRFQGPLGETLRGSIDESGGFVRPWKDSTSNQQIQAGTVSSQTQVLSNKEISGHREPQAHISEPQSHLETEKLEGKNTTGAQEELHHQIDLSSSNENDSTGEESHSNGIIELGGLSTSTSSINTPSKKLEALSNKAVKKLTVPERQAYEKALAAHQVEKRETRAIKRAQNATKIQSLPSGGKLKKLTKDQLDLLDPQQREEYLATYEADRLENQRRLLEEATCRVADILAEGHTMPLPEHREMAAKIAKGSTFYPRQSKPTYRNRFGEFRISEVLDQGKPIHVEQFSFNVFAPAFLANNRDKWEVISQKTLVSAFQIYIGSFYSHVLGLAEWLRSTATAPDALTVEEAKNQVQMRNSEGLNTSTSAVAGGGDNGQSLDHGPTMFLSPLSSANLIEQPENANAGDIAPEFPRPSDTTADLELSDDRGAKILRSEHPRPGGIHTNGMTSGSGTAKKSWNNDSRAMASVAKAEAMDLAGASQSLPEEVESMDIDIDEAELFLQQKYFPSGTASAVPRCLSCGQVGHNSSVCPVLSCTSCGTFGKHSTASCPLNMRCGKCRERGHSMEDCLEKLARANFEAIACDMCGSMDHLEIACHYIWRSFEPKPEETHRVSAIPVHCYRCGASDHYGPECGLHRGRILSGGRTWSRSNLQKYLDPASQQRALSAGVDYSITPRSNKQFSIKGKATDPIPIDDSDDETFIRAKIGAPIQKGHIRFGYLNEDYLARRSYENALARSHGPDSMQSNPGDMSYHPAQPSQQPSSNRPSGPPQGMLSLSMRGPNNGGRGKKGPNIKTKPGKKKRNRVPQTKADTSRMQNEAKARKRG
jgi:hypothetical protein